MTPRKLGSWPSGSPEWHAARRWRIGGSEIGQAAGWSPYGSRADLLTQKLTGPITEDKPSPAMLRGTVLEDGIRAWGNAKYGYQYDDAYQATFLHPVFDFALYNPDGVTTNGILVECKTASDRSNERGWGRAGTADIPLHYLAQVQWGMRILDLPYTHLLVLHGASNGRPDLAFSRYKIRADPKLQNRLLAIGARFHKELLDLHEKENNE